LEIDELYDNEMETFLEKIKNMKPEDDNKLIKTTTSPSKNLNQENFLSFKSEEKENQNELNLEKQGFKINQKKRADFKKFLLHNEETIKSTTRDAKSKVKSYINESLILENKHRSVSKVNQIKLNRSSVEVSSNKKSLKLSESKSKINTNLNSSLVSTKNSNNLKNSKNLKNLKNIIPLDKSLRISSPTKDTLKNKRDNDKKVIPHVPRNENTKPLSKSPHLEIKSSSIKNTQIIPIKNSVSKNTGEVSENLYVKKEIKRNKNFPIKKKIEEKQMK
jgi:hypothetical protein